MLTIEPLIRTCLVITNGVFEFLEDNPYDYHRFFDHCMEDANEAGNDTEESDEASHPEQKKTNKKVLKPVKVFQATSI